MRRRSDDLRTCLIFLSLALGIVALLALPGCGTRENARAAAQADQGIDGAARLLTSAELAQALATLTPEQRQQLEGIVRQALALMRCSRGSLAPVIALLGEGKPVQVETTVKQAVLEPEVFIAAATKQAGRAEAEAQAHIAASDFWQTITGGGGDGSLLETLTTAALGAAGLGSVAGAGFAVVRKLRATFATYRTAIAEATDHGDRMEQVLAETGDLLPVEVRSALGQAVAQVKSDSAAEQAKKGVHRVIAKARGRAPA